MNDQLPGERRLPDQTRARVRAELLHHAEGRDAAAPATAATSRRRWVPALAAAAAVVVVGAGGTLLVQAVDDDGDTGTPAGPASSVPTAPESGATEPSPPTPTTAGPAPGEAADECSQLLQARKAIDADAIAIEQTTVRLYQTETLWFVCDEWAALDGGEPTMFAPQPIGSELQRDHLRISMNFSMTDAAIAEYVAGGALPDDAVTAIRYEFPDGHVQEAVVRDGMWAMAYFPTEGPLGGGGRMPPQAQAAVTVDYRDGTTQEFVLDYPMDFCAQVNHGC